MASSFDDIRKSRRKRGEDARNSVLSRAANGYQSPKKDEPVSEFAAIRNRTSDVPLSTQKANKVKNDFLDYKSKIDTTNLQIQPKAKEPAPTKSVVERPIATASPSNRGFSHPAEVDAPHGTITNHNANVQQAFAPKGTVKGQLNAPTLSYPTSPNITPYEEWYQNNIAHSPLGKLLGGLQKADRAVSNVKAGAIDTATLGASQGIGRAAIAATPGGKENLEPIRQERIDTPSYKTGELLGYLPPGAAAERAIAKVGGKALTKAPKLVQGITKGAGAGALDAAAQEGGDVAFRGKEFDPWNVAIGAGVGAAFPLAGKGLKYAADKTGLTPLLRKTGQAEAIGTVQEGISAFRKPQVPAATVKPIAKSNDSWFNRLFGSSSNIGIKAGSKETRTGTGMQIVNNPLKNDTQGVINHAKEIGRAVKNDYVDFTDSLKHLGGDVQDTALDARRANNLANTWVHDVAISPEGEIVGNSLKDVIGAVPRGQGNAFDDYLVVRHAPYRVARGEMVYAPELEMNDVAKLKARRELLEKRHPEFKRLGEDYDKYNENLLELGKNFGLISDKQKTAMRTENPHYAPNRRQFSTSERYSQFIGAKKGYSGQKAPIKDVSPTGSARKIVSPVRTTIEATGAWMNAGMRNRVMQSILKQVELDPKSMEGIVEVIPEHMRGDSLKEINDALQDGGLEGLTELLDNEFNAVFTKTKVGKTDNIVTAMVDGQPVKMRIMNPEIFKALQGVSPQDVGVVMGTFRMLSNATKHGATGALAPLFAAKGATTDVATALIQSKHVRYHAVDLVHAVFSSIANKFPKGTPGVNALRGLAQDFKRTGGEYSAALRGDRALNRSVGALRREPFLSPKGIVKGTWATAKSPFKLLGSISDISENVNRIAAYKGELRRGGNVRTPENIRNAMRESQEITTNFSRKGAKSDNVEAFIPYSNAAVQGLRRFGKQWAKHPVKTTAMVTTLVILPKVWETAMFGNDPDYQKLPARTRYRNLIVSKNADGTFVQLPMPPEYEAIGAMAGDAMTRYKDKNPVEWGDAADAIMNAYTPPFVSGLVQGATQGGGVDQSVVGALNSTVVGPIAGYAHNQSWTGSPIVPQRLQGNSPYMQKDEKTSSLASWVANTDIGKKMGLSPIKLDYLAKQYGGDIARLGLPQLTDMGGGTKVQSLLRNFIVDPVFTNNLSRDYYNRIDKVTQNIADVGDGAESPAWLTDEVKKIATSRAKGSSLKELTVLSAEKRSIQGNKALSAPEKSKQLRENQRKINNIYLEVTSTLEKLGVPE